MVVHSGSLARRRGLQFEMVRLGFACRINLRFQFGDVLVQASQFCRAFGLDLGPLRPSREPYRLGVEAFFDNLLPDNRQIRERIQRRFHTPSIGAFDLLQEIGRDCVGAGRGRFAAV